MIELERNESQDYSKNKTLVYKDQAIFNNNYHLLPTRQRKHNPIIIFLHPFLTLSFGGRTVVGGTTKKVVIWWFHQTLNCLVVPQLL